MGKYAISDRLALRYTCFSNQKVNEGVSGATNTSVVGNLCTLKALNKLVECKPEGSLDEDEDDELLE